MHRTQTLRKKQLIPKERIVLLCDVMPSPDESIFENSVGRIRVRRLILNDPKYVTKVDI